MRLKNYTREALVELERQRDATYEEEPLCENGCNSPVVFDVYGRRLCRDCVTEAVREVFEDMLAADNSGDAASEILADIFADFTDSEILTYIESRFEKL